MDEDKPKARPGVFITEDSRQRWDKEYFARLVEERNKEEAAKIRQTPVQRDLLRRREKELKLESRVGKVSVINAASGDARGGFYCDVCDVRLKDSLAYVDHMNGKNHQRALGMSMRVERSTVEQVKARLQKAKEHQDKAKANLGKRERDVDDEDFFKTESELRAEERARKRQKKRPEESIGDEVVKQATVEAEEAQAAATDGGAHGATGSDSNQDEAAMMALMGFSGFSSTKG